MVTPVKVRMYQIGFGDCFLIRFPTPKRERLVLIDCGVHSQSTKKFSVKQIVEAVVADITAIAAETDSPPRIDVVVATHRHRDHVVGFDNPAWMGVEVGEVWMPWTEDPADPVARDIQRRMSTSASHLMALAADDNEEKWRKVQAIAENNLVNAEAMSMLHNGFESPPDSRYYLPHKPGGDRELTFTTPVLPGVTVHVLGPPRDEAMIADDKPPGGTFLRAGKGELTTAGDTPADQLPFAPFTVDQRAFRAQYPHLAIKNPGAVVNAGKIDALAVAAKLENYVNSTSLILAFEYKGATLLFPGDAEGGNWTNALTDPTKIPILARTDLYKVGHHGSHNGTPKDFVNGPLNGAQTALVPVAATTNKTFGDIPRPELLTALTADDNVDQILRSDQPPTGTTPGVKVGPDGIWIEVDVLPRAQP